MGHWLESEGFYDLSYDIWHTFFFDANIEAGKHGWVEVLHDNSENPDQYRDSIASIELSSILILWALAAQRNEVTNDKTLFMLGCITSMARTGWIWNIGNLNLVMPHLRQNLVNIKMLNGDGTNDFSELNKELLHLLQKGVACKKLFDYLKNSPMSTLRERIKNNQLEKGETLWQGERHGLCILNEPCDRNSKKTVSVMSLNNPKAPLSFGSNYLLPVNELIDVDVIPIEFIGRKERIIIHDVLKEISDTMGLK